MASKRILRDTVHLYNYIGEIDDEAAYQVTILTHCYCPTDEGISVQGSGRSPDDNASLYLFDSTTTATDENGRIRKFIPFQQWIKLEEKEPYWTISDRGDDFFLKVGCTAKHRITGYSHKKSGSRRMWHFKVVAR